MPRWGVGSRSRGPRTTCRPLVGRSSLPWFPCSSDRPDVRRWERQPAGKEALAVWASEHSDHTLLLTSAHRIASQPSPYPPSHLPACCHHHHLPSSSPPLPLPFFLPFSSSPSTSLTTRNISSPSQCCPPSESPAAGLPSAPLSSASSALLPLGPTLPRALLYEAPPCQLTPSFFVQC